MILRARRFTKLEPTFPLHSFYNGYASKLVFYVALHHRKEHSGDYNKIVRLQNNDQNIYSIIMYIQKHALISVCAKDCGLTLLQSYSLDLPLEIKEF